MKFMHISDLHLGKRVNEFSMLEDQKDILRKILKIADEEKPQALLIAGDVYDKSIPTVEAIQLFDDFLCELSKRKVQTFIISGNHDSAERMAFGGRLMKESGVYVAPVYAGKTQAVVLEDEWGPINIYLLPFVKPAGVRRLFEDEQIDSYNDALRVCVENMNVDPSRRNVLVTHQFVTGALRSDSEEISIGGSDNVDAAVFEAFDYTALGHIHRPQSAGADNIRYCGTPLKYSFSECSHEKSVTVVELAAKGSVTVRTAALVPLHDMREIKGTYMELTDRSSYAGTATDDYIHVTLTDEDDIPDAVGRLRAVYPNIMKLDYDNKRTRSSSCVEAAEAVEAKSPMELFEEFYEAQNNSSLSEEQRGFCEGIISEIWEGEI